MVNEYFLLCGLTHQVFWLKALSGCLTVLRVPIRMPLLCEWTSECIFSSKLTRDQCEADWEINSGNATANYYVEVVIPPTY